MEVQLLQMKLELVQKGILKLLEEAGVSASEYDEETVGTYIIGLVEDTDEIEFADLNEIMLAYIPGFEAVGNDAVRSWLPQIKKEITNASLSSQAASTSTQSNTDANHSTQAQLVDKTTSTNPTPNTGETTPNTTPITGEINPMPVKSSPPCVRKKSRTRTNSSRKSSESESICSASSSNAWSVGSQRRMSAGRSVSESSMNDPDEGLQGKTPWPSLEESSTTNTEQSDHIDLLLGMFPDLNIGLISRTLEQDHGELELTITHLLDHQAMQEQMILCPKVRSDQPVQRQSSQENPTNSRKKKKSQRTRENSQSSADLEENAEDVRSVDAKTRNKIINKYSFMPEDIEDRTYKPQPSFDDSKKMVRYRNGQVVSTRGERFSEVKKETTDDMKKTFINLKPARKYRFH